MTQLFAAAAFLLVSHFGISSTALRGWLVTRNDNLSIAYQRAWSDEIDPSLHAFEALSPHWSNPDSRARLQLPQNGLVTDDMTPISPWPSVY